MPTSTRKPILHCKDHKRFSRNCASCLSTSFNGGQQPAPISREELAIALFELDVESGNIDRQTWKNTLFKQYYGKEAQALIGRFAGRYFERRSR